MLTKTYWMADPIDTMVLFRDQVSTIFKCHKTTSLLNLQPQHFSLRMILPLSMFIPAAIPVEFDLFTLEMMPRTYPTLCE